MTRLAQPRSHHVPALKAPTAPAAPANPNSPTWVCDKWYGAEVSGSTMGVSKTVMAAKTSMAMMARERRTDSSRRSRSVESSRRP
ncbi:Uncharacterised protein [Mycobacteroides abscessus]|nr:Uncharacterised protein [Mycobacteroides abscessus]